MKPFNFEENTFYLSKDKQNKTSKLFWQSFKDFGSIATFNHFPFLNLDIANSKKEKRNKN